MADRAINTINIFSFLINNGVDSNSSFSGLTVSDNQFTLTAADGKLYCINEAAEVSVLSAGDEFKLLATVPLGDSVCYSSIAIAQKQLFIRTGQNLYCVGK